MCVCVCVFVLFCFVLFVLFFFFFFFVLFLFFRLLLFSLAFYFLFCLVFVYSLPNITRMCTGCLDWAALPITPSCLTLAPDLWTPSQESKDCEFLILRGNHFLCFYPLNTMFLTFLL